MSYDKLDCCLLQTICLYIVLCMIISFSLLTLIFLLLAELFIQSNSFFLQFEISWKNIGIYICQLYIFEWKLLPSSFFCDFCFQWHLFDISLCNFVGATLWRKLNLGCKVARFFMGALRFCDDLLFLAPTKNAMKLMLDTYLKFAAKFYLQLATYSYHARPNSSVSVEGQRRGRSKWTPC